MEPSIKPFPRRKAPGKYGGKPVKRDFYFTARDDDRYPSESQQIRATRMPEDPNRMPSWSWAIHHAAANDLWLVVPIRTNIDESDTRLDVKEVRSSIWRTGKRAGYSMTSEWVYPNLYVRVL